jgi:hypothetical protein
MEALILAAILGPLFWWIVLGLILWLVRKFKPEWEKTLFQKIPND